MSTRADAARRTEHREFLSRILLAVLLLGILSSRAAAEDTPPLAIEDYWRQVEATRAAVKELDERGATPGEQAARLAELAAQWEQIDRVALPDGAVVVTDHSALARTMRRTPPNLEAVDGALGAVLAVSEQWPAGLHDEADLQRLQSVLARAEFQTEPAEPSPVQTWWESLLDRLDRWLVRLFPDSADSQLGSALSWVLNIAGVVALAALLAYALRELLANLAAEAHVRAGDGDVGEVLTADSAFQRAQQLAEVRDYRTAVRYLYLSTLLALDERGVLRYDRTKTNREYLRAVSGQPALAATLREVIDVFDRVWYGYQPVDAATYARYQARVAELRQS